MVVAAAAAAAAEEEELRHMGPASGVKQVEQTDIAAADEGLGGDDDEILRFMDSADGYLLLMDSLSSALRKVGLIWQVLVTRWVHHVFQVHCLIIKSNLQPLSCKWIILQTCNHQSQAHIFLCQSGVCKRSNSSDVVSAQDSTNPKLRYRGSAATPDGSTESDTTTAKSSTGVDGSSQVHRARSKALSVFGALVSPKLRTTQVSFETALEIIVELANSRSAMLSSFSQIKHESEISA